MYFVVPLLILIAVFLYLIMPSFKRHKELKKLEGKYISHRGLHNLKEGIPENSLKAFEKSAIKGYPIELDIRLTKDGEVVVFHDSSLERACGVNKSVYDLTLNELKEYTLFGTQEKIPTFKEVLDAVDCRVPFLVELKDDVYSPELLVVKTQEILHDYKGDYFVQSFNPKIIEVYKKRYPDLCRGQLSTAYYNEKFILRLLGSLLINFISRPHFVSYEHFHKGNVFLNIAKLLGAFPICWTLKSQEDLDKAKPYFKAYIFEDFIPKENE